MPQVYTARRLIVQAEYDWHLRHGQPFCSRRAKAPAGYGAPRFLIKHFMAAAVGDADGFHLAGGIDRQAQQHPAFVAAFARQWRITRRRVAG